ncbi:uncharacterized protein [Watersipora subatra]|uniref:uncharacterized protein n=1 Tax=Watersipora subatra TaxID=2589382 RepID=UPI00355B960C
MGFSGHMGSMAVSSQSSTSSQYAETTSKRVTTSSNTSGTDGSASSSSGEDSQGSSEVSGRTKSKQDNNINKVKYEYHMKKARVGKKCNEIVFPDQSSSSCKEDTAYADILSSTVVRRKNEERLHGNLAAPVKQRLLYPGLAKAIRERHERKHVDTRAQRMKLFAAALEKAIDFSTLEFKDFATEHIELTPIKGRKYRQSDAGFYDLPTHTLAYSSAKNIAYHEDGDPGLEWGLPIQIDASNNVRLLLGDFAKQQAVVNSDLVTVKDNQTAAANKAKIKSHLEAFKLKRPTFTLTDEGFVDADVSVGIAGARFFEKKVEEELDWPPKHQREECEKKESCARRRSSGRTKTRRDSCRSSEAGRRGSEWTRGHKTPRGSTSYSYYYESVPKHSTMSLKRRERSRGSLRRRFT